jgi:hypothetical protein
MTRSEGREWEWTPVSCRDSSNATMETGHLHCALTEWEPSQNQLEVSEESESESIISATRSFSVSRGVQTTEKERMKQKLSFLVDFITQF